MRRPLIALALFALLSPHFAFADPTIDVDVYATNLLVRNQMMIESATVPADKARLEAAKSTLKQLQLRWDVRVILASDLYDLLADFDAKTKGGTLSAEDYAAFLQKAKPALDVLCNNC